jgi:ribosomal protein L37AE/L43A
MKTTKNHTCPTCHSPNIERELFDTTPEHGDIYHYKTCNLTFTIRD